MLRIVAVMVLVVGCSSQQPKPPPESTPEPAHQVKPAPLDPSSASDTKTLSLTNPDRVLLADDGAIWVLERNEDQIHVRRWSNGTWAEVAVVSQKSWWNLRVGPNGSEIAFEVGREQFTITPEGSVTRGPARYPKHRHQTGVEYVPMGEEVWSFDDRPPMLTITSADGSSVAKRLDRKVRMIDALVAAGDRVVMTDVTGRRLFSLDREGHARRITPLLQYDGIVEFVGTTSDSGYVLSDGVRVAWVEKAEGRSRLKVVSVDGGIPETVLELDASDDLRLAAIGNEVVAAFVRSSGELRLLPVGHVEPDPQAIAATNDPRPLATLPLHASTRKTLARWGVQSLFQLDNERGYELKRRIQTAGSKIETELNYVLGVALAQPHFDAPGPLSFPPIDPKFLDYVDTLGLPRGTLATLRAAEIETIGQLVQRTPRSLAGLELEGVDYDAVEDALEERGLELDMRAANLGQHPAR